MENNSVSVQALQRMPIYLEYLKTLPSTASASISASAIAEALGLCHSQVRKDLAAVSGGGKPKVGYIRECLVEDMEAFLGCTEIKRAVVVGMGTLGRFMMDCDEFAGYGMHVVAGFEPDQTDEENMVGTKYVFPMEKLRLLCSRVKIHVGIITVPARQAQQVCDLLTECGVMAIWNFTPVALQAPEDVLVYNQSLASSLSVLSTHITRVVGQNAV